MHLYEIPLACSDFLLLCLLTIGDERSAGQHFAEHELDHGQDDAHQAADDGHAEQEVVLKETEDNNAASVLFGLCRNLTLL